MRKGIIPYAFPQKIKFAFFSKKHLTNDFLYAKINKSLNEMRFHLKCSLMERCPSGLRSWS